MTIAELFKKALLDEVPVIASVTLKDGANRTRIGIVANLTETHVTIFDAGKGFRSTPLELVQAVALDHEAPRSIYQAAFELMIQHLSPKTQVALDNSARVS
jgi:hypothetical protein